MPTPAHHAIPELTPRQFRDAIEYLFGGYGSQRAFASYVGIHETTVRRYVSGSRRIPEPIVVLLACMFQRQEENRPVVSGQIPGAIERLLERANRRVPPPL